MKSCKSWRIWDIPIRLGILILRHVIGFFKALIIGGVQLIRGEKMIEEGIGGGWRSVIDDWVKSILLHWIARAYGISIWCCIANWLDGLDFVFLYRMDKVFILFAFIALTYEQVRICHPIPHMLNVLQASIMMCSLRYQNLSSDVLLDPGECLRLEILGDFHSSRVLKTGNRGKYRVSLSRNNGDLQGPQLHSFRQKCWIPGFIAGPKLDISWFDRQSQFPGTITMRTFQNDSVIQGHCRNTKHRQ